VAPGLGNGIGMMYNATKAQAPLVVTAGQQDSRMLRREPILSHDLAAMAAPVSKWSTEVRNAHEMDEVMRRAFKVANDPPFGPVFVALPIDVMEQDTANVPIAPGRSHRTGAPDPHGIQEACALLRAANDAGVEIRHPVRVTRISPRTDGGFEVDTTTGSLHAERVVMATGGRSLPKSGSDGAGLEMALALGHTLTQHVVPSLVPLLFAPGHWMLELAGLATPVELRVTDAAGKRLVRMQGAMLCTHFGISGPVALDISRHWTMHHLADPGTRLQLALMPDMDEAATDRWLLDTTGRSLLSRLRERFPERMARSVLQAAGVQADATAQRLERERRRELVRHLTALDLPVTGDRGFTHAETTAGGVPLSEIRLESMESRVRPGLHLVGEMLDVDGRIGGFNFQWAWASGFVAGTGVARSCAES
jgi:predicted Rossmann fold flavoprotein